MRASQEEKERSHERIIASAAQLMRRLGIEGASVNDVMKDAGLTHGGFYKHFDSKDALLAAALDRAFGEVLALLESKMGEDGGEDGAAASAQTLQAFYLSDGHVASAAIGCPIAALSGDVARATPDLKARFGEGVRRVVALMGRQIKGSERSRRIRATRDLAMMAGAVMIARASDPETAREVLTACRDRSS